MLIRRGVWSRCFFIFLSRVLLSMLINRGVFSMLINPGRSMEHAELRECCGYFLFFSNRIFGFSRRSDVDLSRAPVAPVQPFSRPSGSEAAVFEPLSSPSGSEATFSSPSGSEAAFAEPQWL